jgi:hypothetical protein
MIIPGSAARLLTFDLAAEAVAEHACGICDRVYTLARLTQQRHAAID